MSAAETILIKRYKDGRFYNVNLKKLTSWEEIYRLMSAGADVRVLDDETMEDLTGDTIGVWLARCRADGVELSGDRLRLLFEDRAAKLTRILAGHKGVGRELF